MTSRLGRPHRCVSCDDVIAQYREGKTLSEIGAKHGRDPGWIYGILARHKIPKRISQRTRPSNADIVAMYRGGEGPSKIARRVKISRERVRQILVAGGVAHTDRRTRRHTCTDVCRIVQGETAPVAVLPLAKQTGVSPSRLVWAMRAHHIQRNGRRRSRHQCGARCELFRQALADGESASDAARRVKWPTNVGPGRLRVYHPDWPWPVGRPSRPLRAAKVLLRRLVTCHTAACSQQTCSAVAEAQAFFA